MFDLFHASLKSNTSSLAPGISLKTQELYALVFLTRYLDLIVKYYSVYNTLGKLIFIGTSFATVLWAFSIYLEAVAILPQLVLLQRSRNIDNLTGNYVFLLGAYRSLYLVNWIYRFFTDLHRVRWIRLVQTALYADFFYYYIKSIIRSRRQARFQKGKVSCSVVEYWSASSQGSCSFILPYPRRFSVGKSELEVCVNNEVSTNSCNTTKTGAALFMLRFGPATHNTTSETEYLTATPHAISDTANKFTIIRMGCCNSSTPKGEGNVKSLVPEAVSTGNITVAATFIFWFVTGLGATASKSRLICPPLTVTNITSTRQNVYFQYTLPYMDASDESINVMSEKEGILHILISSWVTSNIVKWFYDGTSTFFIVAEQVVPRLKSSGHTCSMSPNLGCLLAKLKNTSHIRRRVESMLPDLCCPYVSLQKSIGKSNSRSWFEISTTTNTLYKVEDLSGFSLSTKTQEYICHRKTGTGYIPVPHISVFPIKLTLETEAPMLVYVLARNGTLFDYIHHVNGKKALSWHILLKIASESAAALAYLHSAAETSKPMIIHGNVNSSNILLSDCFVAKVFGFGSSRLVRVPSNESQMNTLVQQTVGYLDPEYLQTGQLTDRVMSIALESSCYNF
ncbi:hypothetical protein DVH24_025047 [Malus domestica]|uniref:ER lumen protein-retaining receptor n=1 Tax=Malus domestica TaxID=3750 RepID=A0A498JND8_MALDO|nr:hypothetical protein DVH24_025047 [Malus domestica]